MKFESILETVDRRVMHSQTPKGVGFLKKVRFPQAYGQRFIAYSNSSGMSSLRVTANRSYVTHARSHGTHHLCDYRESFSVGTP